MYSCNSFANPDNYNRCIDPLYSATLHSSELPQQDIWWQQTQFFLLTHFLNQSFVHKAEYIFVYTQFTRKPFQALSAFLLWLLTFLPYQDCMCWAAAAFPQSCCFLRLIQWSRKQRPVYVVTHRWVSVRHSSRSGSQVWQCGVVIGGPQSAAPCRGCEGWPCVTSAIQHQTSRGSKERLNLQIESSRIFFRFTKNNCYYNQ